MNKRKEEVWGAGMVAAEKYAVFFRKSPLVATAYIFGSVALRGDGNDVDMVLEVSDANLGFAFLQSIYGHAKSLLDEANAREEPPTDEYDQLKQCRILYAYSLLGMTEQTGSEEFHDILYGGRFVEWDVLCREKRWEEAWQIENESFKSIDLFLMPPAWKTSEKVRELLPNWTSTRPWAKRSFYNIMVLQSRKYNPQTGHFNSRRRGSKKEELLLQKALVEERMLAGG